MIPHFYIEYAEFRAALDRGIDDARGENEEKETTTTTTATNTRPRTTNSSARYQAATRALRRGMLVALLVIAGVYVGIACVVCRLTEQQHQSDPDHEDQGDDDGPPPPPSVTKISAIVIGIGRMLSASLLAYFSIELPRYVRSRSPLFRGMQCFHNAHALSQSLFALAFVPLTFFFPPVARFINTDPIRSMSSSWLGVTYASQKHVDYYKHIRIRDENVLVDDNDAATKTNNKDSETAESETSATIGQATQEKVHASDNDTDNEKNRTHNSRVWVGRKELTFRVCWSILGHFFIMVPLLVLYCCTVPFRTVVVSTLLGSVFGIAIVSCVWRSHTHWSPHHRTVLAMVVSGILALASAAAFAAGGWYVKEVWHNNTEHTHQFTAATFLGWLLLLLVWHGVYYRLTQRKLVETHHHNTTTTNNNNTNTNNTQHQHQHQRRRRRRHTRIRRKYNNEDDTGSISFIVNRHHNITMDRDEVQQIKDEWRYGQSTFQPPKSVTLCFATTPTTRTSPAAKTSTTTTSTSYNTNNDALSLSPTKLKSVVSSLMGKIKRTKTKTETNNGRMTSIRPTCNDNNNNSNTDNDDDEEILPTKLNLKNNNDDTGLNLYDDEHFASTNRLYTAGAAGAATETTTQHNETTDTNSNRPRNDSTDGTLATSTTSATVESYTIRNNDSKDADDEIDNDDEDLRHTATAIATDTIGTNESSDLDIIIDRDDQEGEHATNKNPTLWYMMKVNSCCRRRRHYDVPRRVGCDQFSRVLKWFLYTIAATVHLFLTIIIIGATIQQNVVREALTPTFKLLYPQDYNEGEMCAWNKVPTYTTTGGSTNTIVDYSKSDIRTFPSLQDVHDANYTVIHCGECGHCSNYNDLSLQWTTRTYLAESAREW